MKDEYYNRINNCEMCGSDYPSSIKVYKGNDRQIYPDFKNFNILLFVLEGRMNIIGETSTGKIVKAGEFTLMDSNFAYKTISDDSLVVAYHFNPVLSNCTRTFLNRFIVFSLNGDHKAEISILAIREEIRQLVEGVVNVLSGKDVCSHYMDIKIEELFISLTMYYSLEELYGIFYNIVSDNLDFRSFVFANYEQVESVDDFAQMANMSKITFIRTFQKTFGISPAVWLRDRKCESIIKDIVLTQIPFSELSYKYAFSSPAYFTLFCKKRWGKTPNELRKERVINVSKV